MQYFKNEVFLIRIFAIQCSRRSTNVMYNFLNNPSTLCNSPNQDYKTEDDAPYFKGNDNSIVDETSCTLYGANESFLKSNENNLYQRSSNTTPSKYNQRVNQDPVRNDSLFSFSNISEDNKFEGERRGRKVQIIGREKLSKRAKTILRLENIIKQLKDPSLNLTKTRNEGDNKYCKSFRNAIKQVAEQLKYSINEQNPSVDSLKSIMDSLKYLDKSYQDNEKSTKDCLNEIHVYVANLAKLCKELLSIQIKKNKMRNGSVAPRNHVLSEKELKPTPTVKDK